MSAERLARIKPLYEKGLSYAEISSRTGIKYATIINLSANYLGSRERVRTVNDNYDHSSVGDPRTLTPEQAAWGIKMGISPARLAFVLSCPKTGNATGVRKGGGSIG